MVPQTASAVRMDFVSSLNSLPQRRLGAGPCAPLSTLRFAPRGARRTARGTLFLHCEGLAPSTPCRSPGAPAAKPLPKVEISTLLDFAARPCRSINIKYEYGNLGL